MEIEVRLFAGLAERLGTPQLHVKFSSETISLDTLKTTLCERYAEHATAIHAAMVAVNQKYAHAETLIHRNDEVALIPPVSGG